MKMNRGCSRGNANGDRPFSGKASNSRIQRQPVNRSWIACFKTSRGGASDEAPAAARQPRRGLTGCEVLQYEYALWRVPTTQPALWHRGAVQSTSSWHSAAAAARDCACEPLKTAQTLCRAAALRQVSTDEGSVQASARASAVSVHAHMSAPPSASHAPPQHRVGADSSQYRGSHVSHLFSRLASATRARAQNSKSAGLSACRVPGAGSPWRSTMHCS
eukprot:COSAG03_NODE_6899_length_989_cov_1.124719_1_plen_218_part_00